MVRVRGESWQKHTERWKGLGVSLGYAKGREAWKWGMLRDHSGARGGGDHIDQGSHTEAKELRSINTVCLESKHIP